MAVVIPAHNEAGTIRAVVAGALAFGLPIVVDDGSQDGTGDLAVKAGAKVVRHPHNRGYDAALQSGLEQASRENMDVVVTIDADGQHDVGVIPLLLAPIESGLAELVIGIRAKPARWAESLFGAYTKLRYGVPDILCGAKAYRIGLYRHPGRFDFAGSIGTGLALASLRRGVHFRTVPVPVQRRADKSRLGGSTRSNMLILRALAIAVRRDFRVRRG